MNKLLFLFYLLLVLLFIFGIYSIISCFKDKFENINENIPKVIYLTHKEKIPQFVIDNWKNLNPDYQIKFYNDEDCRNFIKNNYPQKFLDYFDMLSQNKGAGPIKGDFWRCLILYKYGGVYADSDIELLKPIKFFLEPDTDFLTCNSLYNNSLNPHLIISRPNNIILEKCINIYVNEKFNLPYKYWDHSIVNIMAKVFKLLNIEHTIETTNINYKYMKNNKLLNYKIQLLQEKIPFGLSTDASLIGSIFIKKAYCSYKNIKVLHNRYSKYNSSTHNYKKTKKVDKNILNFYKLIFTKI